LALTIGIFLTPGNDLVFIFRPLVFLQLAMKHQKEMEQLEKNQRVQLEKLEKVNEQVKKRD